MHYTWTFSSYSLFRTSAFTFFSFLSPVILNTHTNSVFTQHIEIHMLTISINTLSPFGTILLCLLFLSPCHMLSAMHFLPHLRELCNLSCCCPESLPFPLLFSHPVSALSSSQNLFSLKQNYTVPGSSFDNLCFFIMCCWSTLSPGSPSS